MWNKDEFARRLRSLAGENISEFARRMRIPQPMMDRYVKGQAVPRAEFLCRAVQSGVDVVWLLTGRDSARVAERQTAYDLDEITEDIVRIAKTLSEQDRYTLLEMMKGMQSARASQAAQKRKKAG